MEGNGFSVVNLLTMMLYFYSFFKILFSISFIFSFSLLSQPLLINVHYYNLITHITNYLTFTTFHSLALLSEWTKGFDVSKCISVQSGVSTVSLKPWGETGGEGKRYEGDI
jgi:hypothetical protein